jgi:transposase
MVVVDRQGIPLGGQVTTASTAEVKLAQPTLDTIAVADADGRPQRPLRLILDRGYDSDRLRQQLLAADILMICPHRRGRKAPAFNDGRHLRRYRHRWTVERTIAWLGNYRRLTVRYDRRLETYRAFFHIACALITLRFLAK